jgi:propionate catabolism operon transcriptional regulator
MVKIRMFIPHTNLKNTFEEVARQFSTYPDIQIELVHIFGTPQSLGACTDHDVRAGQHDI